MEGKGTMDWPYPVKFVCKARIGRRQEEWEGKVTEVYHAGGCHEIWIQSRSGFVFLVGSYTSGHFISIPVYGVGSGLSGYEDYHWNQEKLRQIMNPVDAVTVAEALRTLKVQGYI